MLVSKCMCLCGDVPIMVFVYVCQHNESDSACHACSACGSKHLQTLRPPTAAYSRLQPCDVTPIQAVHLRCRVLCRIKLLCLLDHKHRTSQPLSRFWTVSVVSVVNHEAHLCRLGAQPCLLPSSAAESTSSAPSPEKNEKSSQSRRKSRCSEAELAKLPIDADDSTCKLRFGRVCLGASGSEQLRVKRLFI